MSGLPQIWEDEIGRCFCAEHRRVSCHECCLDFVYPNQLIEEEKGLRKPTSKIENLCKDKEMLERGIRFMLTPGNPGSPENLEYHRQELARVTRELDQLRQQGRGSEINKAAAEAQEKSKGEDAELAALNAAMAASNIQMGTPEAHQMYEKYVGLPPSAKSAEVARDPYTCSYCRKASSQKLLRCSGCLKAYYCDKKCQRCHWKAHKEECKSVSKLRKEEKKKLSLTWAQLEAFGGMPANGKTLEVRFIQQEPGLRLIALCKDRQGVVKRVAAYTNSRAIPDFSPGMVLSWKNPRFHWFMDGSNGARIEEEDLADITIRNS